MNLTTSALSDPVAVVSIIFNIVVLVFQTNLARSMAELKVYMHQNFIPIGRK